MVSTQPNRFVVFIIMLAGTFLGGYVLGLETTNDYITRADLEELILQSETKLTPVQEDFIQPDIRIRSIDYGNDPIKGIPKAKIAIVEFSDFQCPFCKRFFQDILPELEKEYIHTGKIILVYKDFPIQTKHRNALPTHIASECAQDQEKFWEFHDKLFEAQDEWAGLTHYELNLKLIEYGSELGFDYNFTSCLNSEKYLTEVLQDFQEGRNYGVTGTPTFFIGNDEVGYEKIVGAQPISVFRNIIDRQLEAIK